MDKFAINREYRYSEIKKYVSEEIEELEYGNNEIGEQFLVFKDTNGLICSFILSGTVAGEYVYKCIWNEFF